MKRRILEIAVIILIILSLTSTAFAQDNLQKVINAGSAATDSNVYSFGSAITVLDNTGSLAKTNCSFDGWNTAPDGEGIPYTKNQTFRMPARNVTLYAQWEQSTFLIAYELNGGVVNGVNPATYTESDGSITLINPTKDGYDFIGWSGTDIEDASPSVTIPAGSTGDRAYTANWSLHSYKITYNLGSGTAVNPDTYTIESSNITLNTPTRQNWYFDGWSGTGISGTLTTVTIPTGSTGDRTYTANWLPVHYANSERLWNISAANATLSPAFHPNTYEYLLAPDLGCNSSTITVTPNDPAAALTINGKAAKTVTLSLGSGGTRQAAIRVVSADRLRSCTYTVKMVPRSSDATLSNINAFGDILSPGFSPSVMNYTLTPKVAGASVCISVSLNDPYATVRINGESRGSILLSAISSNYPKTASIEVTAADGVTKKTYIVTASSTSNNADLENAHIAWGIDSGVLSPEFKPSVTSYTLKPAVSGTGVKLVFQPVDNGATIRVNGQIMNGSSDGYSLLFGSAVNLFQKAVIEVRASDGKTKKAYTFTFNDPAPSAYLASVRLSAGTLSKTFSKTTYSYKIALGENQPSVTLTPAKEYDRATMTVNGQTVSNYTVSLANGKSATITVKVKYGSTAKTYTFAVSRAKSTNNSLASLTASAGTFDRPLSPNVTNYTLTLNEFTKSATIFDTAASSYASVSFKSKVVTLSNGQTKKVSITVRAQSGAKKTYTVTVRRAASSDTGLQYLKTNLAVCPLTPVYSTGVTTYTVKLPAKVGSVTISAKTTGYKAAVYFDGSKKSSKKVTLQAGQSMVVQIKVVAQSGAVRIYRITVSRDLQ